MRLKRGFIGLLLLVSTVLVGLPCVAQGTESAVPEDDVSTIREDRLRELTDSLSAHLENRYLSTNPEKLTGEIEEILSRVRVMDTLLLSDAYYFLGVHHYQSNRFNRAQDCFNISIRLREALAFADRRYANGLSNLAVSLLRSGDYRQAQGFGLKALEAKRAVSGNDSSILVVNYVNIASIFLELNDTGHAVEMAEAGLKIASEYPQSVPLKFVGDLYQVIGLSLYRGLEYNNSLAYCREALRIYEKVPEASVDSRILMHNTIAQVYRRLDLPEEAEEFFRKGLAISDAYGTRDKSLLSINFSGFLARSGRVDEAEAVLQDGLERVRGIYGPESREYYMMLISVAGFVNDNLGDNERSLSMYNECFSYVQRKPWDISMKKYLVSMYAEVLADAGKYDEVLRITEEMVITEEKAMSGNQAEGLLNGISEDDFNILEIRYKAFNALAREGGNTDYLRQAVATGWIMTSLYDHQRLEMSEEESRTSFSSDSREVYTGIIDNYARLYEADRDAESLKGLFEFTERSKVAGFLASIRELNAARFSLPEELTQLDSEIRREIGFYKELMVNEKLNTVPDSQKFATWENVRFRLLRSRDSLVRIFEEQYPLYYNLKFRTEVTPLQDVRKVIGRGSNLLSYILTDDRLYIFISNSRRSEVITQEIDTLFFASLKKFRDMLSSPPERSGSRAPFNEYMDLAYHLYQVLLEPAEPYLKGDKIIISPDNILSYLPFETLVTDEFRSSGLLYREAPFALKKYRFSYIYSVTLSSETMHRSRSLNNRLLAFAPTYEDMELDDSLLISWPALRGEIRDLPFAILEAEDAVDQCGGTAFIGESATEGAFKREVKNYKIIHLAMHTLVDDRRPAFSRMLFTGGGEGMDDGMLNTYEVYSLPLQAMMVVLSSCNTGSGMLVNGEGILSLARGFLYAGSRSAVMSMWAVDDVSASSVIHSFYKNMRGGQTKSSALRNARLKFLRSASQGQSHPYYWSALVIYGDDTPLWYDRIKLYTGLLIFLLAATILVAIVYRGPRS